MENINKAIEKLDKEFESLTRRGMIDSVMEYLSSYCFDNPDFTKNILNEDKDLKDCLKYITRKASDYLKDASSAFTTDNGYGGEVPDDLCYEWSVEYYSKSKEELEPVKQPKIVNIKDKKNANTKKDKKKNDVKDSKTGSSDSNTQMAGQLSLEV